MEVLVPADPDPDELASALSLADLGCGRPTVEDRTLTPHPSFDNAGPPSIHDFHYLYQASLEADHHDWPSDEDSGPMMLGLGLCSNMKFWASGAVHKRNVHARDTSGDVMRMMMNDGRGKSNHRSSL